IRKILFPAIQRQFTFRAEAGNSFRADCQLDHASVKVSDKDTIILVVLGKHSEGIGFYAQIDVLANQDRQSFSLRFLDAEGQRKNAVVHRISAENRVAVFGRPRRSEERRVGKECRYRWWRYR